MVQTAKSSGINSEGNANYEKAESNFEVQLEELSCVDFSVQGDIIRPDFESIWGFDKASNNLTTPNFFGI